MSLLTSATAVEDSLFDVIKMTEDVVVHSTRTLVQGFAPLTRRLPERPTGGLVPTPGEMANHTFDLVDRLVANLRGFTADLVALAPETAEKRSTPAKVAPKAHAA